MLTGSVVLALSVSWSLVGVSALVLLSEFGTEILSAAALFSSGLFGAPCREGVASFIGSRLACSPLLVCVLVLWALSDCGNSCFSAGVLAVLEVVTSCAEVGPGASLTTSDSVCKLALSVTPALSRFVSEPAPELLAALSGE